MTKAFIEQKIQSLLLSSAYAEADLESSHTIADQITNQLSEEFDWLLATPEAIESFCLFFIQIGFAGKLAQLLSQRAAMLTFFPWAFLVEALTTATGGLQDEVKELLIKAANDLSNKNLNSTEDLARSHSFDHFDSSLPALRENRRRQKRLAFEKNKSDLFDEAVLLSSQGLYEEAEKKLNCLLKLHPGHVQALDQLLICKQKKVMELFSKSSKLKSKERPKEKKDPSEAPVLLGIAESQKQHLLQNPQMAVDFSIAHWMWDNPEGGLSILNSRQTEMQTASEDWLKIELLLKARHFVEVLAELPTLEFRYAHDPESTWAAIFYRAQALWGLGDKFSAIETLESLCAAHPDYRSAGVLLAEMKEDLE